MVKLVMEKMNSTALLIDGDNVSPDHAESILSHAREVGNVLVRRVYCDATLNPKWDAIAGLQICHAGRGKNAADLLLAIDAMDFATSSDFKVFVLVSSDGDFVHLANRLREKGKRVVGIGEAKSPPKFQESCTNWHSLTAPVVSRSATEQSKAPDDFDWKIQAAIVDRSTKGNGTLLSILSTDMKRLHNARISTRPEKTWRAYLSARPDLYVLDPRGPEARVRFKPNGFPVSEA